MDLCRLPDPARGSGGSGRKIDWSDGLGGTGRRVGSGRVRKGVASGTNNSADMSESPTKVQRRVRDVGRVGSSQRGNCQVELSL